VEASQSAEGQQEQGADEEKGAEQEAAQENENVVVAESGQEPLSTTAQHNPNAVGPASAPPPDAQSGVPLPEDRAAGVQPNPDFRGNSEGLGPDGHPIATPPEGEAVEQDGTRH
jgi:hypothetical protein